MKYVAISLPKACNTLQLNITPSPRNLSMLKTASSFVGAPEDPIKSFRMKVRTLCITSVHPIHYLRIANTSSSSYKLLKINHWVVVFIICFLACLLLGVIVFRIRTVPTKFFEGGCDRLNLPTRVELKNLSRHHQIGLRECLSFDGRE